MREMNDIRALRSGANHNRHRALGITKFKVAVRPPGWCWGGNGIVVAQGWRWGSGVALKVGHGDVVGMGE